MSRIKLDTLEFRRFTRQWWGQKARDLFWITLVTLLIWVYADMEFTDNVEIGAKLVLTTDTTEGLQLLSPESVTINFMVRGDLGSLDRYRRLLTERGSMIRYRIPEGYGPGEHELRLVGDVLGRDAELFREGLSVLSASPDSIRIRLDEVRKELLPVIVEYTGAKLASEPTVTPAQVTVEVAESRWRQIPPGVPRVIRTRRVDLKNEPTGTVVRKRVELVRSIGGVAVRPERNVVEVVFKIEKPTDTRTFKVTVAVQTPPTWPSDDTWREYQLERKDKELSWRKDVTVSGAKDDLAKLRPEDVQAFVMLTDDDKKPVASWLTRKVIIYLPADLRLKVVGEAPTVSFKLVKSTVAPGS